MKQTILATRRFIVSFENTSSQKGDNALNGVSSKFPQVVPELIAHMVDIFHDFSVFHIFHSSRIEESNAYGQRFTMAFIYNEKNIGFLKFSLDANNAGSHHIGSLANVWNSAHVHHDSRNKGKSLFEG